MDVFISWSGTASHKIAIALRDWLPTVLHTIDPWVSSEDIAKGTRWSADLAKKLKDCRIGIICINPCNVMSPWLNFEAGAISKTINGAKVFPVLQGMSPSDLTGPLAQFQVTRLEMDDFRKLVRSINEVHGDAQAPWERINKTFEHCWSALQKQIEAIDYILLHESPAKIGINKLIKSLQLVGFTVEKGSTIHLGVNNSELAMWLSLDGSNVAVSRFHSIERAKEICEQGKDGESFQFDYWVFDHLKRGLHDKLTQMKTMTPPHNN